MEMFTIAAVIGSFILAGIVIESIDWLAKITVELSEQKRTLGWKKKKTFK